MCDGACFSITQPLIGFVHLPLIVPPPVTYFHCFLSASLSTSLYYILLFINQSVNFACLYVSSIFNNSFQYMHIISFFLTKKSTYAERWDAAAFSTFGIRNSTDHMESNHQESVSQPRLLPMVAVTYLNVHTCHDCLSQTIGQTVGMTSSDQL